MPDRFGRAALKFKNEGRCFSAGINSRAALIVFCFLALAILASPSLWAQDADRIAKLEQQVAAAQSAGDNAWMLTSAALVLLMTGPGLALFYGGLVRKKNV